MKLTTPGRPPRRSLPRRLGRRSRSVSSGVGASPRRRSVKRLIRAFTSAKESSTRCATRSPPARAAIASGLVLQHLDLRPPGECPRELGRLGQAVERSHSGVRRGERLVPAAGDPAGPRAPGEHVRAQLGVVRRRAASRARPAPRERSRTIAPGVVQSASASWADGRHVVVGEIERALELRSRRFESRAAERAASPARSSDSTARWRTARVVLAVGDRLAVVVGRELGGLDVAVGRDRPGSIRPPAGGGRGAPGAAASSRRRRASAHA